MTTKRDIPASSAANCAAEVPFSLGRARIDSGNRAHVVAGSDRVCRAHDAQCGASSIRERGARNERQHRAAYRRLCRAIEWRAGLARRARWADRPCFAFRTYADQLGAPMRDPGIAGLGYIQRVAPGGEACACGVNARARLYRTSILQMPRGPRLLKLPLPAISSLSCIWSRKRRRTSAALG